MCGPHQYIPTKERDRSDDANEGWQEQAEREAALEVTPPKFIAPEVIKLRTDVSRATQRALPPVKIPQVKTDITPAAVLQKPPVPKPAPQSLPQERVEDAAQKLTSKLAELAAKESTQRDAGTLNEQNFRLESLRELAHMLGLRRHLVELQGRPNQQTVERTTNAVRKALQVSIGGSDLVKYMKLEKPDFLR